ncbi:pre-mRNA-splicing factor SYF2 [Tieghemiomyces parasiticus]|uniref:Pre-mRNA-splicing factor SYF2 n=1 Tax=Tieghemiomyces parasiticus TaxID=78921 RepID=A0A9W8DM27_9FUNG|nr:pre-mRNA-splicing factor SYF2 [Tieghemiomyces parasiticus]
MSSPATASHPSSPQTVTTQPTTTLEAEEVSHHSEASSDTSEEESDADAVEAVINNPDLPDALKARADKLKQLRARMRTSVHDNRKDIYAEHQRSKIDPRHVARREREQREATILQARELAEDRGEDYERSRFWEYSIEAVDKYNAKQEAKRAREDDARFSGHAQWAEKKYRKLTEQLKPDLQAYRDQKARDAVRYGGSAGGEPGESVVTSYDQVAQSLDLVSRKNQPSKQAVAKLAQHVEKELEKRDRLSRQRKDKGDITYINDKNKRFNKRIAQAYDKYTQEVRDSFERGTAL